MITKGFYGRYWGTFDELASIVEPIRNGAMYYCTDTHKLYIKQGAGMTIDEYYMPVYDPGTWEEIKAITP